MCVVNNLYIDWKKKKLAKLFLTKDQETQILKEQDPIIICWECLQWTIKIGWHICMWLQPGHL